MTQRVLTIVPTAALALTLAGLAGAATVRFEADLTDSAGVDGDALAGAFEIDDLSGVMSLTLDIDGLSVATTGPAVVSGDLSNALSLVGAAVTGSGAVGTVSVDWVSGGSAGGAATSALPSVFVDFVGTLEADADGDGRVGGSDFIILSGAYGGAGGPADFNRDGTVGGPDFVALAAGFGQSAQSFSVTGAVTSVVGGGGPGVPTPEPASAALYMIGGLIVSSALRRRR